MDHGGNGKLGTDGRVGMHLGLVYTGIGSSKAPELDHGGNKKSGNDERVGMGLIYTSVELSKAHGPWRNDGKVGTHLGLIYTSVGSLKSNLWWISFYREFDRWQGGVMFGKSLEWTTSVGRYCPPNATEEIIFATLRCKASRLRHVYAPV